MLIALNKIDLVSDRERLDALLPHFGVADDTIVAISGATGEGIGTLVNAMLVALDATPAREATP